MKIIDKKIKKVLKSAARKNHRSVIVILGSSGFHCISSVLHVLTKVNNRDITTLCCSNDSSLNQILKDDKEHCDPDIRPLDLEDFKPQYCSYNNLEENLHEAFDLVVVQDLEASNILSLNAILPKVKGGGAILLLMPMLNSIEELKSFSLANDGHPSRFGKRFIQSLDLCPNFLVVDESLNLLSSSKVVDKPDDMMVNSSLSEKIESVKSRSGDSVIETLVNLCLTGDQAELLYKFLDLLKKRTFHSMVSASSAYGRGKSAALGLAIAGAIAMNYSNIFISSSAHNNVDVLFRFLLKGLDALNYEEGKHYDLIESANPLFQQALIGLNIFKDHPQSVRFIFPEDVGRKLEQAELVIIDEAASIPFHKLKHFFGPYIVLMSSSTSGPISTSPFLYKRMIENIQSKQHVNEDSTLSSGSLQTVALNEPILYGSDDGIESWCNHIFCMESTLQSQLSLGCPETKICELYCVSRDVLFSGSIFAEKFLKALVSIFNQSNYVSNSNELLKLADSPDYQIFVLLPPLQNSSRLSPEVLCAIMVHIESNLPSNIVKCASNITQPVPMCFNDWNVKKDISRLRGLHIINIATHPQYKKMGYGLRAVQLLKELYEGKFISLEEKMSLDSNDQETNESATSKLDSSLLLQLADLKLDNIDYMCVFFNLSEEVFSFWKKAEFVPLHMSSNKTSDKVPCVMFKAITEESRSYMEKNMASFTNHYFVALSSQCKKFPAFFALSILNSCQRFMNSRDISKEELDIHLKPYHMKSLEKYCIRLQDLNTVIHIIPTIAKIYFKNMLQNVHLPVAQEAILLSYGLQNKSLDAISKDLQLQSIQIVGLLNRTLKKITSYITGIIEKSVESTLISTDVEMKPLEMDLDEELEEAAVQVQKQQEKLLDLDVSQYAIKGSEDEWQKALFTGRKTLVSIKSIKNKVESEKSSKTENENKFKKPKKQFKKKKH